MKLGSYQLLGHLGSEPAGDWYQAHEAGTERLVRILVCWDEAKETSIWLATASRLRILAQINHAAVIPVLELCLDHRPPFAALAKPTGISLTDQWKKVAHWPEQSVLEMGHCIAAGLAEAHRLGMAHGCLTEAQIWIDEFQDASIDFAQVAQADGGGDADLVHTVPADQKDPLSGAAADVAAMGQILLRMIYGPTNAPIGLAGRTSDKVRNHPSPARPANSLPDLLDWMTASDPDARPSAAEVVRCIGRLMGDSSEHRRVNATGVARESQGPAKFPQHAPDEAISLHSPRQLGRYRLLKKLGEGGLGIVYLAEDSADGKRVAVKTLHAHLSDNEVSVRRFRKEARLLSEVKNAHVCQLLEFNEDRGVHYLVMEYLEGESLGAFLAIYKKLPEPVALALVSDVARALGEAHRNGIVHRDVKPDNIMLLGPWKAFLENDTGGAADLPPLASGALGVKLCDFGLARHIEQSASMNMTKTGQFMGTPLYMSPEQAGAAEVITPASDVYSLGATLFHLLTGRPPFQAASIPALYSMHLNADAPSPQEFNPDLSAAVCQVVRKALAKEPSARYADADALLLDLERMQRGEPTHLVVHPRLPVFAPGEMLDYDWVIELNASPEELWPFVSNTERLNQAIGLSAVNYKFRSTAPENPQLLPRLERTGTIRKPGLTIAWVEHAFEWIEGRRMGILREYSQGVFKWMASTTELQARADGGTTLHHRVRLVPAGLFGRLVAAIEVGIRGRSAVERVYRRMDAYLTHRLPQTPSTDPFVAPAAPLNTQQTSNRLVERLLARGVEPLVAESLVEFILRAPEQEIARIRPIALAQRLHLDEEGVIEACLIAAHEGILVILWDILCPKCRVPSAIEKTMRDIRSHGNCQACHLDFELDFANSVELVFRVDPNLRPSEVGIYCIGGPSHSPHVAAQVRVAAGERLELTMCLAEGSYRLRGPQLPYTVDFRVHPEAVGVRGEVRLIEGPSVDFPRTFRTGAQTFLFHNEFADELVVRVERMAKRRDALTAARVSALARFRDLFPQEVLSGNQLVSVAHVTLLATDLVGAAELYRELGDARTFGLLHEHFRVLEDHIRREHGAVVKTHNEGILATFHDPACAVRVALELPTVLAKHAATKDLRICLGVHRGSAMVATINGKLDYFGTAVKLAMSLPGLADASALVLSQPLVSDAEVQKLLARRGLTCRIFDGPADFQSGVALYRLDLENKPRQLITPRPQAISGPERLEETPIG